ncbi:hypothetical protein [Solemya velesiana gill symbiont]|uniref:hypothetical protein n=1 Tax=Solemya velesiana gill symbiont TaxID=1918948 RepID=UPI000997E844|nr:hypothetical protein [Solemya velesiana gill symbiont]
MEVHCEHTDHPHVLLEVRQDLIASDEGAEDWAGFIHEHLSAVLDASGLLNQAFSSRPKQGEVI